MKILGRQRRNEHGEDYPIPLKILGQQRRNEHSEDNPIPAKKTEAETNAVKTVESKYTESFKKISKHLKYNLQLSAWTINYRTEK